MIGHSCGVNLRRFFFVSSHTTDSLCGTIVVAGIVGGRRGKRWEAHGLIWRPGILPKGVGIYELRHVVVGYVS